MLICINGELKSDSTKVVEANDGGFLYGDGLFETIRADGQRLLWQQEHLDRLDWSCSLSEIHFDRTLAEQSLDTIRQCIEWPAARVRLTVTRDATGQPGQHIVTAQPYTPPTADHYAQGVACIFAPNRRNNAVTSLPQMKRVNYADCLFALRSAHKKGTFEAIFQEPDGHLIEGSISNLFVVLDGALITPPTGNLVLPGITRQKVIDLARESGRSMSEESIHSDQLSHVSEIFISNSLFGVLPVQSLGSLSFVAGPVCQLLRKELGRPFYVPK